MAKVKDKTLLIYFKSHRVIPSLVCTSPPAAGKKKKKQALFILFQAGALGSDVCKLRASLQKAKRAGAKVTRRHLLSCYILPSCHFSNLGYFLVEKVGHI